VAVVVDVPLAAIKGEQGGGGGARRAVAGDATDHFGRGLADLLHGDVAFDEEDLSDPGEVQILIDAGGSPDSASRDAPTGEGGRFPEVGRAAIGEQGMDRVGEARLVVFDDEDVVGGVFEQLSGQLALGQQRVGGDGFAGQVEGSKKWDDHPDFVGLFDLLSYCQIWCTALRRRASLTDL
jgi:hypothetical protein